MGRDEGVLTYANGRLQLYTHSLDTQEALQRAGMAVQTGQHTKLTLIPTCWFKTPTRSQLTKRQEAYTISKPWGAVKMKTVSRTLSGICTKLSQISTPELITLTGT